MHDLSRVSDWSHVLDGTMTSTFIDPAVSSQTWPGGEAQSSREATALVTCRRTSCTTAEMDAITSDRPWGQNNPRWQLFAFGPARNLSPASTIDSSAYVAVWVGDDPSENDGRPLVDGDETNGLNPGRGRLTLLAHAYGAASRRVIEATVAQAGGGVRVLSWREVR